MIRGIVLKNQFWEVPVDLGQTSNVVIGGQLDHPVRHSLLHFRLCAIGLSYDSNVLKSKTYGMIILGYKKRQADSTNRLKRHWQWFRRIGFHKKWRYY